jgi:hypothetical protein
MARSYWLIPVLTLMASVAGPSAAPAQDCGPAGCGPKVGGCLGNGCVGNGIGLFAPDRFTLFKRPDGNQPACATRTYPLSDWNYIRKYCGPTLIPGTCYGHFQTKWRSWGEACPQEAGEFGPAGMPGAVIHGPIPQGVVPGPIMAPAMPTPELTPNTPVPSQPLPLPQPQPGTGLSGVAPTPAPLPLNTNGLAIPSVAPRY